jgi:DNA (cytosine-5)-methyltransferase 1
VKRQAILLDLFCCQGGAAKGYHDAGFKVIGVDINPQPRYPFEFHQADAFEFLKEHGRAFDAIHASPPCQAFTALRSAPNAKSHPDLIEPTRNALTSLDVPWIIENVPGAPLHDPTLLCGSMFGLGIPGYQLRRHRLFESNVPLSSLECAHAGRVIGIYGSHVRSRSDYRGGADFPGEDKLSLARRALGIDWMDWAGLSQSIPPAFTEHLGKQLLAVLTEEDVRDPAA